MECFEDLEICAKCGGRCCKNKPGATLPEDFGAPNQKEMQCRIKVALKTGRWTIDWWEGDPRYPNISLAKQWDNPKKYLHTARYIRPAEKEKEGRLTDASWGGECTFLTDKGCEIFDTRPSGCRGVKPVANDHCPAIYASTQDCAIAWIKYTNLLDIVYSEVRKENKQW